MLFPVLLVWSSVAQQQWAGTLSFDDESLATTDVPLNATTGASAASFSFYFNRNSGGRRCAHQLEPSLQWSLNGSEATALGDGADPNFYTYQGALSADGGAIVGGVVYHPPFSARQRVGTFTLRKVNATNPQMPSPCTAHASGGANPTGLWPAPARFSPAPAGKGAVVVIDPAALALQCDGGGARTCASVSAAWERGVAWALGAPHPNTTGASLSSVVVRVLGPAADVPLQLGADESYTLAVNATHAVLEAPTQWGALYALESFFQLVRSPEPWLSSADDCDHRCDAYTVGEDVPFSITDAPRVRWRGLMIDTARHYLPPPVIKRAIDAMAAAKMNALHWHVADDQSFPLCLDAAPQLCAASAFRDHATGAPRNYSTAAVRDLVAYATARGVRIVPEIDLPGHSAALARGAPGVYADCPASSSSHPLPDPRPEAGFYALLDAVVGELAGLFPDETLHMGGDEVKTDCWDGSAPVQAWMKAQNLSAMGALAYFQQRVQGILATHGRRAMFWDEFWAAGLPAANSTYAEIRGTTFAALLAGGRPALTTGIGEAWYVGSLTTSTFSSSTYSLHTSSTCFKSLLYLLQRTPGTSTTASRVRATCSRTGSPCTCTTRSPAWARRSWRWCSAARWTCGARASTRRTSSRECSRGRAPSRSGCGRLRARRRRPPRPRRGSRRTAACLCSAASAPRPSCRARANKLSVGLTYPRSVQLRLSKLTSMPGFEKSTDLIRQSLENTTRGLNGRVGGGRPPSHSHSHPHPPSAEV
jgi:hypothetical protein